MSRGTVAEAVRVISKLGPPKKQDITAYALSKTRCACNKVVDVNVMKPYNTGVITAMDNVCPGCTSIDPKLSRIVCCTCKTVVARLAPHVDQVGFKFLPGVTYHTNTCGHCVPGLKESSIIEKLLYDQRLKVR